MHAIRGWGTMHSINQHVHRRAPDMTLVIAPAAPTTDVVPGGSAA